MSAVANRPGTFRVPRRSRGSVRSYAIGGAGAAAGGALGSTLALIGEYAVAVQKGASLAGFTAGAFATAAGYGAALAVALYAVYAVGSYALSLFAARETIVFQPNQSQVYRIRANQARYLATIPVVYGNHISYATSVLDSGVDAPTWSNYSPNVPYITQNDTSSQKKPGLRFVLCIGSGDYDIDLNAIRVGSNPIVTSRFIGTETVERDNLPVVTEGEVGVVRPGELFGGHFFDSVARTRVADFDNAEITPFHTAVASGARNTFDRNGSNSAIFTSLRADIGVAAEVPQRVAVPTLRAISEPGDTVLNVTINYQFNSLQMDDSDVLSGDVVSDYIVTGTFIQALDNGTLINADGTPVLLVDEQGNPETADNPGLYPESVTSITGAVPFTHANSRDAATFVPSQQTTTDGGHEPVFRRYTGTIGFTYDQVRPGNPGNVGFVICDRRLFSRSTTNDSLKRNVRYSVTSTNLPALGDSTLAPRQNRKWMLLLTGYNLIATSTTNRNAIIRTNNEITPRTRLSIQELSVAKITRISQHFFNGDGRNISPYTFAEGLVPSGSVSLVKNALLQGGDRERISVIVTRRLHVYKDGAWTTGSNTEVTRSPVWAIVDMLTSEAGGRLNHDLNFVGSELEQLANYYDAQNLYYDEVVDQEQNILDLVNYVAGLYDFMVYQHGSRWRMVRDYYASNIEYLIFESDCIDSIEATYNASQENIDNIFDISYVTHGGNWTKESLTVAADYFDPSTDRAKVSQIETRGMSDVDAVRRFCRSKLLKSRYRRHIISVKMREIGMILKPNDVIGFVHTHFGENYCYGQVVAQQTDDEGVHFIDVDTNTDIEGVGKIIFRDELGRPTHQYNAELVEDHRFRIDGDITQVSLITDPSRIRTSYSFTTSTGVFYNRCKVISIAPDGFLSYDVTLLIDNQESYL